MEDVKMEEKRVVQPAPVKISAERYAEFQRAVRIEREKRVARKNKKARMKTAEPS